MAWHVKGNAIDAYSGIVHPIDTDIKPGVLHLFFLGTDPFSNVTLSTDGEGGAVINALSGVRLEIGGQKAESGDVRIFLGQEARLSWCGPAERELVFAFE